jgi:8-oxo-dGTP pyrophosphatase MutT (NUDIX family)
MRKPTHAGFMIKIAGQDLYLICHATQSHKRVFVGQTWTITKGKIEGDETPIQAAKREMAEETRIIFHEGIFVDESNYRDFKVNEKNVRVFMLSLPECYLKIRLDCGSFITKGHLQGLPEVDGYMWCSKNIAKELVFASQKELFE